jgi:transketolase
MTEEKLKKLKAAASEVRKLSLMQIFNATSGHPGGALSCADILTYLYVDVLRIYPSDPKNPNRDRFVLSKGHASAALYACLALKGFFPKKELKNFRKIDSFLQGHPDMNKVPGVDMSTGSLGQGVSAANGMALAGKLDKKKYRVYTILGDGELEEGEVWEAAMFASHYKLDNILYFVDSNGLQIDGKVEDVMNVQPIDKKFRAFGFNVLTIDAHNFMEIENSVNLALETKGQPTVIIANSVKGKNVSFMENNPAWHGKAPNNEEYELAISELEEYSFKLKQ